MTDYVTIRLQVEDGPDGPPTDEQAADALAPFWWAVDSWQQLWPDQILLSSPDDERVIRLRVPVGGQRLGRPVLSDATLADLLGPMGKVLQHVADDLREEDRARGDRS